MSAKRILPKLASRTMLWGQRPIFRPTCMTGWPAADTTENDVEGTTRHGGETRSSVSDAHSVKSRLFGDGSNDLLKQMIKARLLADLSQPTELGEDDEDPSATDETLTRGQGNTTKGPGGELPLAPLRIGRFTVLRKLGHGGMGVVYAAYDERLDRKIAIKVLRSELGDSERGRTRMLREAQALARLSHPNVVQVHEVGRWRDHDYVAMEFIDGKTLDRWVGATSRTWKEVLEVVMQAGRGLAEAHRVGLIHRDFKPANVLVGQDGRARVLDFGLARSAAFDTDSLSTTRPIEYEVVTAADAEGMFDVLTYEKGASVVRMLQQFLGEERFQAGIRRYLDTHQYANTETTDLWDAIEEASGEPVRQMMDSWIYRPGHPVVSVARSDDGRTLHLRQDRFAFAPDDAWGGDHAADEVRIVPVGVRTGHADGTTTVHRLLLADARAEVALDQPATWLVGNHAGDGFYRVELADEDLRATAEARGELSPLERYGLVEDEWAL
ncbi:MAG: protein kinase, partial [Myxococcales bacterium]|nr:protein kinase [Myxococcales bacterium]